MRSHNILIVLVTVTMLLLVGSCSSLRVDVDVYKGPLSDHEDIQTERLAVMAIGVKPLLVELRDQLENIGRIKRNENERIKTTPDTNAVVCPDFDRKQPYYSPDFISFDGNDSKACKSCETLIDPQAVRINAVLSLYKDLKDFLPPQVASAIDDIKLEWATSKGKKAALEESHAQWKEKLEALKNEDKSLRNALIIPTRQYFGIVADTKDLAPYHVSLSAIRAALKNNSKTLFPDAAPLSQLILETLKDDFSFLYALGKPDSQLADAIARLLFQGAEANEFAKSTRERARGHIEFLNSLERLFVLHLELLGVLGKSEIMHDKLLQYKLVKAVSRNIVQLGAPDYDQNFLSFSDKIYCDLKELSILNDDGLIREESLEICPEEASKKLLEKHEMAKKKIPFGLLTPDLTPDLNPDLISDNDINHFNFDFAPLESKIKILSEFLTGAGLEHARLPNGLETYIKLYLETTQKGNDTANEEKAKEKSKSAITNLSNALVDFAQKVLAIANNEVLLNQYSAENGKNAVVENIQILQAVGNSILTQANELRFRKGHQYEMQQRLNGELNALREVYSPSPKHVLSKVISLLTDMSTQRMAQQIKLNTELAKPEITGQPAKNNEMDGEINALQESIKVISSTISLIEKNRNEEWLQKMADASPMDIITELKVRIQNEAIETNDSAKKAAIVFFAGTTFDITSLGGIPESKIGDPKIAIDQLISVLSYRYVQEVQTNGKNSPSALKLAQAIEAVEGYRTGLIYIRPASSYLRSSYPATSLQQSDDLGWKNMLVRNFGRSIPLLGEGRAGVETRRIQILNEIDKQSWQNINTVRLEGAGKTNYAIAKDDVGNWTVKTYSTDPEPIVKSALNLATFSGGIQTASAVSTATGGEDPTKVKESLPQPTMLERLHEKHKDEYKTKSAAQLEKLHAWIENETLKNQIIRAWKDDSATKKNVPDLEIALNNSWTSLKSAAEEIKQDKDTEEGARILRCFKALKRFYPTVGNKILSQELTTEESKNDSVIRPIKEKATAIAKHIIRVELKDRIETRKATVDAYYTATTFSGEAMANDTK